MDLKYNVIVEKQGEGGKEAAAQLQQVAQAAAAANTAVTGSAGAMNTATASSVAAKKGFDAFKGTLSIVAGQAFPQLTNSIMVAKSAIESMRASNTTMTAGFATTAAAIAGVAGLVLSAATAWGSYRAERAQAKAEENLSWQESDIQKRLIDEINLLEKKKELTSETARALRNSTGDSAGNRQVQDYLRYSQTPSAQEQLAEIERQRALVDSIAAQNPKINTDTAKGWEEQRATYARRYTEDLENINILLEKGLLTQREANALSDESAIKFNRNIAELKTHYTQLQQIQRATAEQFASGFSQAFVSFLDGTKSAKEAFQDFARSFLSSIAQMIMQQMILNAIKSVGLFAANGGTFMAASGGMYPRFMAAGGMQGVQSVSSPTYFPKFNVVAGEAGREMLTVLARPRMMEVGGMQAVVGSAQGNRLAITSADALAQGGAAASGQIVIQVQGTPEFEARVVSNSVKGAVVQVANDMRQDTPISRGVKGLAS